jgi:hypothetical protein
MIDELLYDDDNRRGDSRRAMQGVQSFKIPKAETVTTNYYLFIPCGQRGTLFRCDACDVTVVQAHQFNSREGHPVAAVPFRIMFTTT